MWRRAYRYNLTQRIWISTQIELLRGYLLEFFPEEPIYPRQDSKTEYSKLDRPYCYLFIIELDPADAGIVELMLEGVHRTSVELQIRKARLSAIQFG